MKILYVSFPLRLPSNQKTAGSTLELLYQSDQVCL